MRSLTVPFLLLTLAACGSSPPPVLLSNLEPSDASGTLSAKNAKTLGWLTAAGQPSQDDLAKIAASGTQCVINLRTDEEMATLDFDEAAAARELGMRYITLPVAGAEGLTDGVIDEARDALRTCRSGGALMH